VRSATGRQHGEIVQGQPGTPGVDSTGEQLAPEHGYDFQVSKLWQGQALAAQPGAGLVSVRSVIGQRDDQDAGVSDQHGRREGPAQHP